MYNLPSQIVKALDIKELYTAQDTLSFGLSLTSQLNIKLLDTKNYFQKMKVGNASNILNHSIATASDLVGKNADKHSFITTAWFISFIAKWFKLVTTRTPQLALGKCDAIKFESTVDFLKQVIDVISQIKVGKSGIWKSFQTLEL